jgi:hypothetical protein
MFTPELKVSLWGPPGQLTWSVNKTDVWDRRFFPEKPMTLKQIHDRCFDEDHPFAGPNYRDRHFASYNAYEFPGPKPVGQLILVSPDFAGAEQPVAAKRLSDGMAHIASRSKRATGDVRTLAMMTRNIIIVNGRFKGLTQQLQVRLYRHQDTCRPGVSWASGGPDPKPYPGYDYSKDAPANGPLEPPHAGTDGRFFWITQRFPAEATFPQGFHYVFMGLLAGGHYKVTAVEGEKGLGTPPHFSLAAHTGMWGPLGEPANPQKREDLPFWEILPWYEPIREAPGAAATAATNDSNLLVLATVVTSAEARDPMAAVKRELLRAEKDGYHALIAENRAWWKQHFEKREAGRIYFSDASRNESQAEQAANSWCYVHSGGTRPDPRKWEGDNSYAYINHDWSPWHADNHFNEAEYGALCVQNQIDRLQMWYDIGDFVLPLARRNAREVYGCRGAMPGLSHVPVRTDTVYHTNVVWEQGMEFPAQLAKMYWQRYDFTGDLDFLRQRAYPWLRAGADFNTDYLTLGEDGCYHVIPTVSQEHRGLTYRYQYNKDSISALCMIKWHLNTTARAAEILGRDLDKIGQWKEIAAKLAPYPTRETPDGPIFVDLPGSDSTRYNLVPVVYPAVLADEITLDSPAAELELMKRTVSRVAGWGHLSTAKTLILQEPGTGAENLLNCRSGRVRLFPAVTPGVDVGFHKFLAKGAFEVSAEYVSGRISPVFIRSLAGNDLRIVAPWPRCKVQAVDLTTDKAIAATSESGHPDWLVIPTRKGHEYRLSPGPNG